MTELDKEIGKFDVTLQQGLKEFDKLLKYIQDKRMSGKAAFRLYDTYGFPIEMTLELARDNGITVDVEGYERAYNEHQQKSKAGAEQKFKGGLADSSEATTNLRPKRGRSRNSKADLRIRAKRRPTCTPRRIYCLRR